MEKLMRALQEQEKLTVEGDHETESVMQHANQRSREPENLFDVISTLGFILHFYCSSFALLLTDLCIDLALLGAILCRQLGSYIAWMILDAAERLLAVTQIGEWEDEEMGCNPIRVPSAQLWVGGFLMMNIALDLLWVAFGGAFSPFYAVAATLFILGLSVAQYRLFEKIADL